MPLSDSFDPSILVLAALAVFIIWKLKSVLGIRIGREKPVADRFKASTPRPSAEIVRLPGAALSSASAAEPSPDRWKTLAEPGSKGWAGLDAIAAADPNFSGPAFIEGARKAYELVVTAFARGDRDTLHNLLAKDVFDSFASELAGREQRGETAEATLAAIDSATVTDAQVNLRTTQITVRFVAKLISVRRNRAGEVIDGNPSEAAEIVDLWTFARDAASRDPNWKLVATESGR